MPLCQWSQSHPSKIEVKSGHSSAQNLVMISILVKSRNPVIWKPPSSSQPAFLFHLPLQQSLLTPTIRATLASLLFVPQICQSALLLQGTTLAVPSIRMLFWKSLWPELSLSSRICLNITSLRPHEVYLVLKPALLILFTLMYILP